jgi:threonine/homoserine/homoserine lactone efflux protein
MESLKFLAAGAFLGLSAGISPGPLLTLVFTETLKHNRVAGIKVALSPLVTDLPVIAASLFIFSGLAQFSMVLALISFSGGIFVAYLGYESLKTGGFVPDTDRAPVPDSFRKGIMTNFLNPHPYLFWVTVGTPVMLKACSVNVFAAVLFLLSFYMLLTGSKIVIVFIVARSKAFIRDRLYIWIMRVLGVILLMFSVFFFYEGTKFFLHR